MASCQGIHISRVWQRMSYSLIWITVSCEKGKSQNMLEEAIKMEKLGNKKMEEQMIKIENEFREQILEIWSKKENVPNASASFGQGM